LYNQAQLQARFSATVVNKIHFSDMAAHTESSELPSATTISPSLTIQPPLSRRGKGPGIILVLDHYALLQNSDKHIDPPPLQKWAEEGYAVAQVLVPGKAEDGGEFPLDRAVRALKEMEECDGGEKGFALVCK
jgi:carboxymethylenebutenolidase